MPVEYSYPRNMMALNSQLPFYLTPSHKHKENAVQLNKRLMELTIPLQNGTIISKEQKLYSEMITNHSPNLWMVRMQITKSVDGDLS